MAVDAAASGDGKAAGRADSRFGGGAERAVTGGGFDGLGVGASSSSSSSTETGGGGGAGFTGFLDNVGTGSDFGTGGAGFDGGGATGGVGAAVISSDPS